MGDEAEGKIDTLIRERVDEFKRGLEDMAAAAWGATEALQKFAECPAPPAPCRVLAGPTMRYLAMLDRNAKPVLGYWVGSYWVRVPR